MSQLTELTGEIIQLFHSFGTTNINENHAFRIFQQIIFNLSHKTQYERSILSQLLTHLQPNRPWSRLLNTATAKQSIPMVSFSSRLTLACNHNQKHSQFSRSHHQFPLKSLPVTFESKINWFNLEIWIKRKNLDIIHWKYILIIGLNNLVQTLRFRWFPSSPVVGAVRNRWNRSVWAKTRNWESMSTLMHHKQNLPKIEEWLFSFDQI
jgi:hypothetical protein